MMEPTSATTRPTEANPAGSGPCPNCGNTTPGNFCPECGQRRADVRVSVRRMLRDALDDQFTLSSALPRTLAALLFRPGHLTREYMSGRIVRYIAPFRLYLFSSLVFFVVLSLVANVRGWEREIQAEIEREPQAAGVDGGPDTLVVARPGSANVAITFTDTTDLRPWLRPIGRRIKRQEERLNRMDKGDLLHAFVAGLQETLPRVVFLLLPVFALILKGLYARRSRFYVEHFVFALHVHAFVFVLFTLMLLVDETPISHTVNLLVLWLFGYLFFAMKRVYGQGWLKTGAKYLALGGSYFFVLVFALVGTFLTVLLLL